MRIDDPGQLMILKELRFEARGDASRGSDPMVLSCGGIFLPHREIPPHLRNWQKMVNLPSSPLSARMIETSLDALNPLENFLRKESLN